MPFHWMASFLTDGKEMFKRLSWKITPSKRIMWRDGELMCTMDGGNTWVHYVFTNEDIDADDWRIAK